MTSGDAPRICPTANLFARKRLWFGAFAGPEGFERLTSGRPEGEDGDLRPAEEAEAQVDEPETAVGVLDHAAHLVEPARVPLREGWQGQAHKVRNPHLSAVRMARELEVEASGGGAHVGEVRLVGEQYRRAAIREVVQYEIQAAPALHDGVEARHVQGGVDAHQGKDAVYQLRNA